MGTMAAMLIATIFSSIIAAGAASMRQKQEYQQQSDLLEQEQNFTREREDLAYQRQKPQVMYDDYLDAGFNPNLAAQAVLGGNAETASTGGSPSAPNVNSAIDAINRSIGQGGQNAYDAFKNEAEIRNIEANTNKTDIEAGLLPRDYELRRMTAEGQLKVWNASVDKIKVDMKLTEQQTELVRQQNLFYGRMSEAEIRSKEAIADKALADAELAYEKIKTEKHVQKNLDADTVLKQAETDKVIAEKGLIESETEGQDIQNQREQIAKNFEISMGNVPLSADGQKYVNSLIINGKFKEAKRFYQSVFYSAMSQELGTSMGTPHKSSISLPLGIYKSEKYDFNPFINSSMIPYWNNALHSN